MSLPHANKKHLWEKVWYSDCNYKSGDCICAEIAKRDPSLVHQANREMAESYYGKLPTNEQILANYEAFLKDRR